MSLSSTPRFKFFPISATACGFVQHPLLGKSFDVTDKLLECLLPNVVMLLGGNTPSPSKVLDTVVDVKLPESHQCLLSVFLTCSNRLGKGHPQVRGLKKLPLVGSKRWLFEAKHHFAIGMKVTNKRKMSASIIRQKQILKSVFLSNSTSPAIQKGFLAEEPGHPQLLSAAVGHGQCVLTGILGPGFSL